MYKALRRLQEAFTRAPALAHFDYDRPIRLKAYASGFSRPDRLWKGRRKGPEIGIQSRFGRAPCRVLSGITIRDQEMLEVGAGGKDPRQPSARA